MPHPGTWSVGSKCSGRFFVKPPRSRSLTLALDGSDLKKLGLPPGPQFGEILRYLLEEVLDHPEVNNRADLEDLATQGGFLIDASPDS